MDVGDRLKEVSDLLECQYGLLFKLVPFVLTEREVAEIKAEKTEFCRNDRLIVLMTELMENEIKWDKFLHLLCDTGQGHLARYISGSWLPIL